MDEKVIDLLHEVIDALIAIVAHPQEKVVDRFFWEVFEVRSKRLVIKVSFEYSQFTINRRLFTVIKRSQNMPLDGYTSIIVSEDVVEQLTEIMIEYECESLANAVAAASAIALERDEAALAQLLAQRLTE